MVLQYLLVFHVMNALSHSNSVSLLI